MTMIRVVLAAAVLAVVPTVAWAQTTTTTTTSTPTTTTTLTTTTVAPTTTTTTATVSRVEDLVCSEPVNQVATCVDPEGRIVRIVTDFRPTTTTTTVRPAPPAQPTGGAQLALTG